MRRLGSMSALAIILALPLVVTITMPSFGVSPNALGGGGEGPPGKMAFLEQNCNTCHPIASQGVERKSKSEKLKGPDLSGVGNDHDAEWIVAFVKQEVELDGEKHDKPYRGSADDLQTIAEWLATLKAAE